MEDTATLPMQNVVQTTSNYGQFKFLGANREVNQGHVEALKEAIATVGNLTAVQPILVNDNYEIIDGQHRFMACQELGLPIHFTVVPGLNVQEARSMNILHKSWRTDDYARSYANTGDTNYQRYIQLKEDYPFNHSIILAYTQDSIDKRGIFKEFRNGEFIFENEEGARQRLNNLSEIQEILPMAGHKAFAMALLKVMRSENYDQARMVRKIRQHADIMRDFTTTVDNLRQLEEVYNHHMSEQNRVRLY